MEALGIDLTHLAYHPVVSSVSSIQRRWWSDLRYQNDVVACHDKHKHLALRQPKGLSLPANNNFVLLLKAFSSRLAEKHLVVIVIQCLDVYWVDNRGKRRDSGGDSAPDGSKQFTVPGTLTPLCTLASPQVWRRELACTQRRNQLKNIQEHFYSIASVHQPAVRLSTMCNTRKPSYDSSRANRRRM
ncbi:hypothetical protein BKA82DRAFT_2398398 [Pisolithus tinctorius]|nr:hypothetical protein BKA82DRAFT_2398398 [Pisolithus tinctorius]